jgi:type I restriction enzyme S subunit
LPLMSQPVWLTEKIGNLPIEILDGDRSKRYPKRSEFQSEGIPFLNSTNIDDNRLDLSEVNFISSEKFAQIKKGRLQLMDIVMTTRGSIGKVTLFNDPRYPQGLINAQMLIMRADRQTIDQKFLFYYLCSDIFQELVQNFASGAAQPQIPIRDLKDIPLSYPPLLTQGKIATILSAYDDLIENNTRRIAILEEMARLIYREWFVHYRFPDHEDVEMVESELGLIPEGWEVKKVTDAVYVRPRIKVPKEGEKPYVPMKSLSETSMLITDIEFRAGNSGSKFQNGDTLFARITPCLENGKTGFVQFLPSDNAVGLGSTEFIVLRSKTLSPEYVYLLARSDDFRNHAIKSMTGATGRQRVQVVCFDEYLIAHPDPGTLGKFNDHVSSVFKNIHVLAKKNEVLRRTRDLLLPRLISGEIDVSDLDIAL